MLRLVLSNISQRPTRTLVSVLAISLGVVLILVSVGLTHGQLSDSAERTRQLGEYLVQPPGGSFFLALNGGTMETRLSEVIEEVEGVEAVTPVLTKFTVDDFVLVFGIELESFGKVNSSLNIVRGRPFETGDEIIVDSLYAETQGLDLGDHLEFFGKTFTISGIYQRGPAGRVLVPLSTLQQLNGTPTKVSMFFVSREEGLSEEEVYENLQARMKGYKIVKTSELQELIVSNAPILDEFLAAIVFVAVAISFLIILLAMYSTITERTREIGILKSLGASKSYIMQLILKESVVISTLGAAVGFVLTFVTIEIIITIFPQMPVMIPVRWHLLSVAMAVAGGALGSIYPALKAARLDPVRALGYE